MKNCFCCNSISGPQITTKFCTCHDSNTSKATRRCKVAKQRYRARHISLPDSLVQVKLSINLYNVNHIHWLLQDSPNWHWWNYASLAPKYVHFMPKSITQPLFTIFHWTLFGHKHLYLLVWYKTKFGSQNFGYQLWCLFGDICNVFKNMLNLGLIIIFYLIKYCGWGIPHNWYMSFWKLGGLPTLVAFPEN